MTRPVLRTRDFARTTLKKRHRVVVRAMAEALFTTEGELPASRLDAFVQEVDDLISPASKTLRFGLLLLLDVLDVIPLFVVGRFSSFVDMSIEDRLAMLLKLERSKFPPFLLIFVAYKTLMSILFFEDEEELRALGYPGPGRERYKRSLQVVSQIPKRAEASP